MCARVLIRSLISAVFSAAGVLAHAGDFDDLVNATAIHCEFFPSIRPADAPLPGAHDPEPDFLVHYGGMNRERTRARVVTTRGAGSREVVVVRTDKAVHFVTHAAGIYMVTTVFGCNERDLRSAARKCVSFGAVNSRHFDASVHWQPDHVFERDRHLASHGFCDHSAIAVTGGPKQSR
jgi:hypothetical protein